VLYHETINEANGIGGLVVGDDLGLKSGVVIGGSRICLFEARHENRNALVQEQRLIAQCPIPWEYFLKPRQLIITGVMRDTISRQQT